MPDLVRSTALSGRSQSGYDRLAKGLGYFSIGLGIAELIAPKAICNAIGIRGLHQVIRAYGVREVATGVAILTSHDPEPWIWARVAGDTADLATVAMRLQQHSGKTERSMLALSALAAVTALDVVCATGLNAEKGGRKTALADYSDRSGFPSGVKAAWGAARHLQLPEDVSTLTPLAPSDREQQSAPAS